MRQILVETQGADGALVEWDGCRERVPVRPVEAMDATGAGDTLAGATLARLLSGETDPVAAVAHDVRCARRMLQQRGAADRSDTVAPGAPGDGCP